MGCELTAGSAAWVLALLAFAERVGIDVADAAQHAVDLIYGRCDL